MRYKVGDKVKVNAKDGASSSIVGEVYTVREVDYSETYGYRLDGRYEGFCEKELDLFRRKEMNTRRTFRLLKDTPEVKKGALFQEACDDGDQEYVLLDDSFLVPGDYYDFYNTLSYSRNTVEDQPNWFEEVEMHWLAKAVKTVKKATKKGKK